MPDLATPYIHIKSAITHADVEFLRGACKQYVSEQGVPCYVLINSLDSPTYMKIKSVLEEQLGEPLYYLNDFYIYTDSSFKTNWHMDTELFAFDRAVNAWILLSPNFVDDPLGFIDRINDSSERIFHSARLQGSEYIFGNYCNGEVMHRSVPEIETEQIHTPRVQLGDILLFNPRRFHRTNVNIPKHAIAFKFIMKSRNGFLSDSQVDPRFWPEVSIFNNLVRNAVTWENVIDGIQRALMSKSGRKELSAGFYPDKFELYKRMVATL